MATIYIVEDDMNIREIEQFALKNSGYETKGFACAAEFEKQLKEELPDLIILDIMLPDKDGLEVLKKLRMEKSTFKIPVIMVTAKSTELDKVKGLDLGADDYMTKPFGVMELISRVKAMLRRADLLKNEDMLSFEGIEMQESKHLVTVNGHVVSYPEFPGFPRHVSHFCISFRQPPWTLRFYAEYKAHSQPDYHTRMTPIVQQ